MGRPRKPPAPRMRLPPDLTYKQVLLDNPDLFVCHYFPHLVAKLDPFHMDIIGFSVEKTRALVLAPAAHGKSTLLRILVIWGICGNPDIRIIGVYKSDDEAQSTMRSIHAELGGNRELIADFGPFEPLETSGKAWTLSKVDVAKRERLGKESTFAVFGPGSKQTLGYRTDWTIVDDVVTEANSSTPVTREKLRQWFNLSIQTGPEHEDSRLTVVGTLFDPEDLYGDLIFMGDPETGEPIYETLRLDAIVDEAAKTTLWPDRWTWRRLMKQKAQLGTLDFNKRYRNIAVDPSRMVFREEHVKGGHIGSRRFPGCLDPEGHIGDYDPSWLRFAGFDPAIGARKRVKFCAHLTLAVGSCVKHERCYWVIDLEREQLTLPQQVDMLIQKHVLYELFATVIETNSYQAALHQAVVQRMTEQGLALRMVPHYTHSANKPDPEAGVMAMAPRFELGLIHIPWGTAEAQRKMGVLVDELVQYPTGRTSDTVMALWMAWRQAEQGAPRYKPVTRLARPLPSQPRHRPGRVWVNPYYERQVTS